MEKLMCPECHDFMQNLGVVVLAHGNDRMRGDKFKCPGCGKMVWGAFGGRYFAPGSPFTHEVAKPI